MQMKYPKLYKLTNKNKLEEWEVFVAHNSPHIFLVVNFGEVDGKKQTKRYPITRETNVGKANYRSIADQAMSEAKARWEKKQKMGYVKTKQEALAKKVNTSFIEGGLSPMLAHKFQDYQDELSYPLMAQPKLDGVRCIATKIDGVVTLWSRTRKPITSCPHIIKEVDRILSIDDNLFLDGELYVHDKNNFEKIVSAVRKKEPSEASAQIEYHVYDMGFLSDSVEPQIFSKRNYYLKNLLPEKSCVRYVLTCPVLKEQTLHQLHKDFLEDGYEGIMIRDPKSLYEFKRSKNLLKLKTFDDAEFEVIGITHGDDDSVLFNCKTQEGARFLATMKGNKKDNQKYLKHRDFYIGKKLTVKYQGLTNKNNVPRFPVAVRIRGEIL